MTVAPECIEAFNKLKLGKTTKWIIYKLSDNQKEIVVEEQGTENDWSVFREKLVNAKSADGKQGARYAVYDVSYEAEGGAGSRNKITFIAWVPDSAGIKVSLLGRYRRALLIEIADKDGVLVFEGCAEAVSQWYCRRDSGQR